MIDPEELITSADAAALLRVKPATLPQWRYLGRGPRYLKVGARAFYRRSDIAAWLAEQMRDPAERTSTA
jgi:hypothetical protein